MMQEQKKKPPLSAGKLIALLIALFTLPGELGIVLLIIGVIGYIAYLMIKVSGTSSSRKHTTVRQQEKFDDCPKPICFHKDKGIHHVRRGKEIDPWDRPDIDISKYQRR